MNYGGPVRRFTDTSWSIPAMVLVNAVCLLVMLGVTPCEGAKARLTHIRALKTSQGIVLDASIEGGFTRDITEAVTSGAPTRFKFLIRVIKRRGFWFDKEVREFTIHHTVTYDVLKKEYLAIRSYPESTEENLTTADWNEMVRWMSTLSEVHLAIPELKDRDGRYYLEIRAEMKCIKIPFPLNYLLAFVALWNVDTPWVRVSLDDIPKRPETIEQASVHHGKGP
ncbi:MAG: DUF4390 domain-containing protein [bacterium]